MFASLLHGAQAGGQAPAAGPNMLSALIPFVAVFAIFYLLIILPQRKKQKKHLEMVNNLRPGDKVITSAGIFGTVMGVQPDRIELRVAPNVKIDVTKSAVAVILGQSDKAESA